MIACGSVGPQVGPSRPRWPVRTGLPLSRSWRTRLPGAAAVEEQVDAIIGPGVGLGRGHRRAEAEGAALRQGDDELEELLGGEFRAVDRQGGGAHLVVEHGGDLADHLGPAAFACDDRGELGKALRFGHHQPVERERHRHQRGAQHQPCQAPQNLLQIAALVERRAGRRPQLLDDPVHNGAKERRFIREAVIEGAFGDPSALRHRLDAGGAIAFGEEQFGGGVEDALTEKCGRRGRAPQRTAVRLTPLRTRGP